MRRCRRSSASSRGRVIRNTVHKQAAEPDKSGGVNTESRFRVDQEYNTGGEDGRGNPGTQRAAAQYLRAGLATVPVPAGEKNPNRPGWQNERWGVEDVPKLWNNGQGIGVLWGEPSGG